MAGEWRESRLADVAEIVMGQSPPGSTYNETRDGLPFFQGVADFGSRYPSPRVFCTSPTRKARPGDILVSVRAPIGRVNIADRECAIGRGLAVIRARRESDSRFIELALRYMEPAWYAIEGSGSVFGNATKRDLELLLVPWPEELTERAAIAHILGTLDDKIELNRRMNETLEAMARTLFKSWFVDFDPVRAKAEGRDPGLPKPLADLFPDSFEDSELGEIPKGWEVKKLGDLLELAYGKALKAEDRQDGNVPVYGSNGQVGWHDQRLVAGPGIVVGRKGNPGIATWVPTDFFPIDTTFYVVPKVNCRSLEFLFHVLRTHDLASLGADSAVPGLNRNLAYMSDQILPPPRLLEQFGRLAGGLSGRVNCGNEETRTLASLRDTLLPRLISGEVRVAMIKDLVEATE